MTDNALYDPKVIAGTRAHRRFQIQRDFEEAIKADVVRCRSAACSGAWRVRGLEYDTGGCMPYARALKVSRSMHEAGGADAWRRAYK